MSTSQARVDCFTLCRLSTLTRTRVIAPQLSQGFSLGPGSRSASESPCAQRVGRNPARQRGSRIIQRTRDVIVGGSTFEIRIQPAVVQAQREI
jgi:hypothetical protein